MQMTDAHRIEGVFRDRGQARLAIAAARRQGLGVPAPAELVEDAAGIHVMVRTTGSTDTACQLLLEYGAYAASVL